MTDALLVTNAYLLSPVFDALCRRLAQAADENGVALVRVTNEDVHCGRIPRADFALFWDKDVAAAQALELRGLRVFNSSSAIAVCDDKAATQAVLERAGLPTPETVVCPLAFFAINTEQAHCLAKSVAAKLQLPVVVKQTRGSWGVQVRLAATEAELAAAILELSPRPLVFQRFVAAGSGCDTRVFVVGGQCIAAMRRSHPTDFRSNSAGNTVTAASLTDEKCRLALAAVRACGLSFGGVDILDGGLVCEVNSNALFLKTEACTGVDIAGTIFRYILSQI